MRKKERQKFLVRERNVMNKECGEDLSGEMLYCEFCHYSVHKRCEASQIHQEQYCLCATAYNRMKNRERILNKTYK